MEVPKLVKDDTFDIFSRVDNKKYVLLFDFEKQ